jgi:hypothetical protein
MSYFEMHILPLKNDDLKVLPNLHPGGWPDILPHFNFYLRAEHCIPIK